jgi:peroxisomal 3,2-trans-enoyl-CoA isomerase
VAGIRNQLAAIITINGTISLNQMYQEWIDALEDAANDKSCVLTVVTGAGDYYCSGNDLSNFAKIPPEGPEKMARDGRNVLK